MDAHQAFCLNFLALTDRWGRGALAIAAAWALSVLGITLTVAAAWLLGERLVIGPSPLGLRELSRLEFWVAVVVSMVNYLRFFRFFFDAGAERRIAELLQRGRGGARVAKRRMHVMDTGGALACRSMLTQRTSPIAKIPGMLVSNSWAGRVRDDCGGTQL